ncbi:MAG: Asp-tRNA(Asn)/Glu-tRNA(Gln) amidotransferase subunit GatC [Bacillota bacterium]|jgi:aspartyl-tRNA(Asn)/glutamyl-tRNA(Gln) amidotransferase subunit C
MQITGEQVKRTAAMAKLSLSDEEVPQLRRHLQEFLAHVAMVPPVPEDTEAVTLDAVEGFLHFSGPGQGLRQEEVLALAPDAEQGFIRVPRVMGHD